MSGHRYLSSNNPFDEDDISDEDFLKNSRVSPQTNLEHKATLQTLKEKRCEIENRTLLSTEKSLGILRDSEQIGIATAEELARQREQLERTDKRLDEINQTLRFSQKHINGIKSVFSSLKNYMSGRNVQTPSPTTTNTTTTGSESFTTQQNTNQNSDLYQSHPITRIREQGLDLRNQPAGSRDFSSRLDANLQEMSTSISTLKGLAKNLSSEIDSQNDLLDNITDKTENADINIHKQNKDMQKILKK